MFVRKDIGASLQHKPRHDGAAFIGGDIRFRPAYPKTARFGRMIGNGRSQLCANMELPDHDVRRGRPVPHDVKRALDYMRKSRGRRITMADLVGVSGVAERTLTKHFRAFLGLAPLGYLRRLRLAAVRETLLGGASGASVTKVATQHGFTHLGRFAVQYHRCFGEAPSATLRRGRAGATSRGGDGESDRIGLGSSYPGPSSRERPSIAILPCQTSLREPAHRWFAESLADAIAAALCPVRSLSVMLSRRTGAPLRDPQRAARELGARYVLIARLAGAGRRLRLIVRVVATATGHHVWGDSYDGEHDDLLRLQDRAIEGIVRSVLPNIRGCEIDKARRSRPQDLDAYGLAMRALSFVFAPRPEATRRALELLQRAMDIDPDYGVAVGLAAWCHGQLVMYNGSDAPARERACALRLAQRAAILDNDDPLVLTARSAVYTMAGQFAAADALLARALRLDPTSAWAWGRSGWLNSYLGNSEVAIGHFRRAISLEPSSASNANNFVGIGSAHFGAGRYDAAAAWMRKALLEQPAALWANRTLSVSYARLGERAKALESLETLRRYCPDLTVSRVVEAIPFGRDHLDRLGEGLSDLGLPA
jgi:TolB-like protein